MYAESLLKKRSALNGKNFLPEEQILSLGNRSLFLERVAFLESVWGKRDEALAQIQLMRKPILGYILSVNDHMKSFIYRVPSPI